METEIIKLFKQIIEKNASGEVFHDNMSRMAHIWGLQGFKRLHRHNACEDRERRVTFQHYVIDRYSENLEPDWTYEAPIVKSIQEMLDEYINWEESVIRDMSIVGNTLIEEGYVVEGQKAQECLKDVTQEIIKAKRYKQDFSKAKNEWEYIRIVDKEIHKKYKEKEGDNYGMYYKQWYEIYSLDRK